MAFASDRAVRWETWLHRLGSVRAEAVVIMANGQLRKHPMSGNALDVEDVLAAARENHGLTDLAHIREAVLEKDGKISIVPVQGLRS